MTVVTQSDHKRVKAPTIAGVTGLVLGMLKVFAKVRTIKNARAKCGVFTVGAVLGGGGL